MIEQRLLIDYFVCSWKVRSIAEALSIFRLFLPHYDDPSQLYCTDPFIEIKSYYGLDTCFYYSGIKIHIGDDLVILDISGKGCRTLESEFDWDWELFFNSLTHDLTYRVDLSVTPKCHISRLDVACDVFDSEDFTVSKIWDFVRRRKYVCKSKRVVHGEGDEEWIYFGSAASDRRLRIYNKALEQGIPDQKWVRAEFQLRNDNALSFLLNYFQNHSFSFTYYGVMHDYLRILKNVQTDLIMIEYCLLNFGKRFLVGSVN